MAYHTNLLRWNKDELTGLRKTIKIYFLTQANCKLTEKEPLVKKQVPIKNLNLDCSRKKKNRRDWGHFIPNQQNNPHKKTNRGLTEINGAN